jgi:predicted transglutaminase-like cysteine proteinase
LKLRRVLRSVWLALGLVWLLLPGNAADGQRLMQAAQQMGPNAVARTQALLEEMRAEQGADDVDKLKAMNVFFNRQILFRTDQDNWGAVDYWSSPLEFLNRGQGDCEDYAIAKYFSLIAMGVSPAKMRMV